MQHDRISPPSSAGVEVKGGAHQLFLFAVRRMATGGIDDAHAAHALLGHFGQRYRRPLILMRAMMLEMSRASSRKIQVAPCCCGRMTSDEGLMAHMTGIALDQPAEAYRLASILLGNAGGLGLISCAQAVAQAFADLGRPIALYPVR